ncbi:MAG: ArnT family glycosyltransferase [Candidatus Aminicenantia bacterium]
MNALYSSFLKKKNILIVVLLIAISVICLILRFKNLGNLSLWMDEGFYYLAAKRILKFGYPLYPSGHVLFKGILYSYFLSFFSLIFGLNELNLRIFSVISSVALVPVLYLFGKKFLNEIIVIISIIIIIFSTWETEYSRTVLYFAPLQLIYLISLYFFYKGFFENQKKYKYLTLVFFLLAPLVHQLGMGLWFCFPALFLIKGAKRFFKKDTILIFSSISLFYLLIQLHEIFFWRVGQVYYKAEPAFSGIINYFFTDFSFAYFKEILKSFPHMGLLIFFGVFLFLGAFSVKKQKAGNEIVFYQGWYYLNLCLIFPLFFLGFFRTHIQPRYLFQLKPIIILLYLVAVWKISQILSSLILTPFHLRKREDILNRVFSIGLFLMIVFSFTDQAGLGKIQRIINRNYQDKISTDIITRSGRFEHYDHKGVGEYVRHYLKEDDLVIAIHVIFQYIYAGRVDYWLWSGGPGTWDAWEKTQEGWKDVYIGANWINNLADLQKVIKENSNKRIWIITSPSILRTDHINKEIADFIKDNSDKLVFRGKDGMSEVYLWHDKGKKLIGKNHTLEAEWFPLPFGKVVYQLDASKGSALFLDRVKDKRKFINFKLNKIYLPGHYKLILRLKTDDNSIKEKILGIAIFSKRGKERIYSNFLTGNEFKKNNRYQDFEFRFFLNREDELQLKILFTGKGSLWLDYFDIIYSE